MVIRIFLGNVGSGKTASCVRDMYMQQGFRKTYSNIKTKIRGTYPISPDMIIKKELIDGKKDKFKLSLNTEFWKKEVSKNPHGINVILDEAHSIINARRAMSKANIIVSDWISLIRRILGNTEFSGDLTLVSQLSRRLDPIAREMATHIRYHVCFYEKYCKACKLFYPENSEMPEPLQQCANCNTYNLTKRNFQIFVMHFRNMEKFMLWHEFKKKTFHKMYVITDIEKYFPLYNSLQWDNMFSELY